MKKIKTLLLLLLPIVAFCSCSTTQKVYYNPTVIDSYVGATHQEIVEILGAPTREVSDGGSGYCLIYEGNRRIFSYSDKYSNKSVTLPTVQFFMTQEGLCRRTYVGNVQEVKTFSLGKTILLLVLLGILPIAAV